MSDRDDILERLSYYKSFHAAFERFCDTAKKAFPPGNDFGIEFLSGDQISREMSILHHKCRVRFSVVQLDKSIMAGRLFFERIVSADEVQPLLELHFDDRLDAKELSAGRASLFSLGDTTQLTTYLAISLLDKFFSSLSSEQSARKR